MTKQKKIKALRNRDDRADQKMGRNDDKTLGIRRANLDYVHNMLKIWSFVHNLFQFGAMINH